MEKNKIIKIIFEREGKQFAAYPVTELELKEAKDGFALMGLDINNCNCGTEACWNGFWWICSLDLNNQCVWYRSDWQCN